MMGFNYYRSFRNIFFFISDYLSMFQYIARIPKLIAQESYYPEKERKSKLLRYINNLVWVLKYKELNEFYNSYGLDIENFRRSNDYLSYKVFARERDNDNYFPLEHTNYNQLVLLRDKYVFSCYMQSSLGDCVPKNIALVDNDLLLFPEEKDVFGMLENIQFQKVILKKLKGECADGVYLLERDHDDIYINYKKTNKNQIKELLLNGQILIQEVIEQHELLKRLNPSSVNTIRIVTARYNNDTHILASVIRLGTKSDTVVDNAAVGGAYIKVTDTGKLGKYGFYHPGFGTKSTIHPISGVVYEDYQLPYWNECVDLVKRAHKYFSEIKTIGWDCAITPDGPVLIEGNDNWEISIMQDACGGLRQRWCELNKL